jgi:hypothetical protein
MATSNSTPIYTTLPDAICAAGSGWVLTGVFSTRQLPGTVRNLSCRETAWSAPPAAYRICVSQRYLVSSYFLKAGYSPAEWRVYVFLIHNEIGDFDHELTRYHIGSSSLRPGTSMLECSRKTQQLAVIASLGNELNHDRHTGTVRRSGQTDRRIAGEVEWHCIGISSCTNVLDSRTVDFNRAEEVLIYRYGGPRQRWCRHEVAIAEPRLYLSIRRVRWKMAS